MTFTSCTCSFFSILRAWTWGDFFLETREDAEGANSSAANEQCEEEFEDSDGGRASGFFIVIGNEAYTYSPEDNVDELAE